jgi:hypothetical protein
MTDPLAPRLVFILKNDSVEIRASTKMENKPDLKLSAFEVVVELTKSQLVVNGEQRPDHRVRQLFFD